MQVNKTNLDAHRIDPTAAAKTSVAPAGSATTAGLEPVAPVRRADEVQISDAGRKLAEGQRADSSGLEELGNDRVQEIRNRIASGAYLTTEAATATARGILQRGDL